jgi:hypothetical protein
MPEEKFFFCRFTQLTVLRILTSAAVMGSDVRKIPEAWDLWDNVCADDRVGSVEGVVSDHDPYSDCGPLNL